MNKFAILLTVLLTVACASPKQSETQPAKEQSNNPISTSDNPTQSSVQNNPTNTGDITAPSASESATVEPVSKTDSQPDEAALSAAKLAAELQKLHNESVYFDYDEFAVKPESRDLIKKQAAKFLSKKGAVLVLEGNADERGSVEYNFALGEKRSTSVKKALLTLGVPATKIKVVSFGNTKPKLDCHEEKCWQENRRVDFVLN